MCKNNSEYNDNELLVLFAVETRAAGAPQGVPQAPQALQGRSPHSLRLCDPPAIAQNKHTHIHTHKTREKKPLGGIKMVCAQGARGLFEPPEGGGWGRERGSRDRPIAEPLCRVPFYPILGPETAGYVGPQERRGYVASTGTNSRRSLWGKWGMGMA